MLAFEKANIFRKSHKRIPLNSLPASVGEHNRGMWVELPPSDRNIITSLTGYEDSYAFLQEILIYVTIVGRKIKPVSLLLEIVKSIIVMDVIT
jgi:hypothetical protein